MKLEKLAFSPVHIKCFTVKDNWVYYCNDVAPNEIMMTNLSNGARKPLRADLHYSCCGLAFIKDQLRILCNDDEVLLACNLACNRVEGSATVASKQYIARRTSVPYRASLSVWTFNDSIINLQNYNVYEVRDTNVPYFTYNNRIHSIVRQNGRLLLKSFQSDKHPMVAYGLRDLRELNDVNHDLLKCSSTAHVLDTYAYILCWNDMTQLELWRVDLAGTTSPQRSRTGDLTIREITIENITNLVENLDKIGVPQCTTIDRNAIYISAQNGEMWKLTIEDTPIHEEDSCLEDFQCPVCFECITTPKLFPCGHTICLRCEQSLRYNDYMACPQCRRHASLGEGESLPTNWILTDYLENCRKRKLEGTAQCSSCKKPCERDNFFRCKSCTPDNANDLVCGGCIARKHRCHDYEEVEFVNIKFKESALSLLAGFSVGIIEQKISTNSLFSEFRSTADQKIDELVEMQDAAEMRKTKIKTNSFLTREAFEKEVQELKEFVTKMQQKEQAFEKWKEQVTALLN
ncbi:hypothetical protein QR680_004014 [Steinernema hermaphroditum]|uniref:RING-type domain-containing protein n=1 Tax=Steinernema hermaphroditum TaxID=289476 RepID=A0AA39LSJ5_9BILA|nr:hypothetical protein QR680_004014 [Steinernema hermaphroditum]